MEYDARVVAQFVVIRIQKTVQVTGVVETAERDELVGTDSAAVALVGDTVVVVVSAELVGDIADIDGAVVVAIAQAAEDVRRARLASVIVIVRGADERSVPTSSGYRSRRNRGTR